MPAQDYFYEYIGIADIINKSYGTDGFLKSILFEHKLDFGASYGLGKAKKQFSEYREKLRNNGEYDPQYSCAIEDNGNHRVIVFDNATGDKIDEFNWDVNPNRIHDYINNNVIKYYVNENTVIGLAEKYYQENPTANKRNFFDDYITKENDKFHRFKGSEKDFSLIMDKLNDPSSQKVLGAYYTPDKYVEISTKYLRNAIIDIKKRNKDYIIIDRCAGSGNLLRKLTAEELTHCIVNTYEAKEWIALNQNYQGKVKRIIPPSYVPDGVLLEGGDALSQNFLDNFKNEFDKRDSGNIEIIMLENPPYSAIADNDCMGKAHRKDTQKAHTKERLTWVYSQMGKTRVSQDVCNQFIWSAFEYYKPSHYILFAPIKYWKSQHLIDKKFIEGYLCNRKYFHADESAVALIHWFNEDKYNETLELQDENFCNNIIKKVFRLPLDNCQKSNNGFAKMSLRGFTIKDTNSLIGEHIGYANTWLNEDNLLFNLPIYLSNDHNNIESWKEENVLMKTADGGRTYQQDKDFLNDCLFYTLLTNKNKCSAKCEIYPFGFSKLNIKEKHKGLMQLWTNVFNRTSVYGLDNIIKDPNNYKMIYDKGKEKRVWKDGELRDWVEQIKFLLQKFFKTYIRPKMLKYELVK